MSAGAGVGFAGSDVGRGTFGGAEGVLAAVGGAVEADVLAGAEGGTDVLAGGAEVEGEGGAVSRRRASSSLILA